MDANGGAYLDEVGSLCANEVNDIAGVRIMAHTFPLSTDRDTLGEWKREVNAPVSCSLVRTGGSVANVAIVFDARSR
jgi:hypothetical protein